MKNTSFYKGRIAFWYLIIFGFSLSYTPVQANKLLRQPQSSTQQYQISGTITDGTNPLPGVTVSIKGKATTGTISDFNGQYTLSASPYDILIFTFMGFKTATEPVDGRKTINIQLQEDITSLQEVRVNAGYYTVKEKERTGSIAKISAKDIEKQPVSNPLAAMQGRLSGVNIRQTTGTPGGGFSIQIRGINSIRAEGNTPLYIVNGVPYSSQSLGDIQLSSGILAGTLSPLNNINPADIESIEILKDADATAIYGSRGANGVVLITTKKGKVGKTKFSINSYSGVGSITKTMDLMNTSQYLAMRREAYANDGIVTYPANAYDVNGTWNQKRDINWVKEFIGGTAYFNNAQAMLSGGSNSTQFLVSGTYRKETTVFPGDFHYSKRAVHSSLTHKSDNNKFLINLSVDYSGDKNISQASDLSSQAYKLAPNAPAIYDQNGNLNWENGTFNNPLAALESVYTAQTKSLIANSVLSYQILANLELKAAIGYTDSQVQEIRTIPSTIYDPAYGITSANSILYNNNGTRSSWIAEPQLNWNNTWKSGKLNVLLGATFQSQESNQLSQNGTGFASNSLINNLSAATTVRITSNQLLEYKYQAFFGRVNYIHNKKYIFNATGRRDGSSRFGPSKRFANFGAIGTAWIFSEENAVKNNLFWLSFGKLRGSFGTTGNDQIGDYQYLDTYSVSTNNYNGIIGLQPSRLFNPDFGWESNRKLELAVELGFLHDRIFLTTAWYKNRSSNQLVGLPLPGTTGFSTMQANLNATVQNTGFEAELRTQNLKLQNFSWSTNLNLTIPKNKLISYKGLEGSTYANTYIIGKSLSIQKLYNAIGISPDKGVYLFEDYDGDGQITTTADRQYIADIAPKWFGGLSNQLSYKNWELDFLFQFVKQDGRNYIYTMGLAGTMSNIATYALNHWPQNGTDAEIQRYTTGTSAAATSSYSRYINSSAAISDASYARLKSLSLSYAIPTEWSKSFSAKIYFQGQNLLTFTNYKGADPENQSISYLPPLKQYTLGLQLNF
jgi:TonB-linked SusC/RagA family outer membrane protein